MRIFKATMGLCVFVLAVVCVPSRLVGRDATALFHGDLAAQDARARGVAEWISAASPPQGAFATGSPRFDGEWAFGADMLAAMALGQIAREHPELRARYAPSVRTAVARMVSPAASSFDREAWGEEALATLDGARGHVAYLGYTNLALEMDRLLDPESPYAPLGDRITDALARRLDASPIGLVETYPDEVYPVDNAAAIASVALRDLAAKNHTHDATLKRAIDHVRATYMDRSSSLLVQRVDPATGAPRDAPRGSGTLLAVYFFAYVDVGVSRALWDASTKALADRALGFGVMREVPRNAAERSDIDSGPVFLGYGVSATGFALAGARIHGDAERFRALCATVDLFGAPIETGGAVHFTTGGPLGDALLLAMATAPQGGRP